MPESLLWSVRKACPRFSRHIDSLMNPLTERQKPSFSYPLTRMKKSPVQVFRHDTRRRQDAAVTEAAHCQLCRRNPTASCSLRPVARPTNRPWPRLAHSNICIRVRHKNSRIPEFLQLRNWEIHETISREYYRHVPRCPWCKRLGKRNCPLAEIEFESGFILVDFSSNRWGHLGALTFRAPDYRTE